MVRTWYGTTRHAVAGTAQDSARASEYLIDSISSLLPEAVTAHCELAYFPFAFTP